MHSAGHMINAQQMLSTSYGHALGKVWDTKLKKNVVFKEIGQKIEEIAFRYGLGVLFDTEKKHLGDWILYTISVCFTYLKKKIIIFYDISMA